LEVIDLAMPISRIHAAEALDAEQLVVHQPSSTSSQNKRRQPLAESSSNNNNNNNNVKSNHDDDDAKKLLSENVNRLIQNLRRCKNEQVEAVQANYTSELNNTQNIFASTMVKIPRNIKSMTLAEFHAVYKTDLLATLLQRSPPEQQAQQQQDDEDDENTADVDNEQQEEAELDPMEQTLQMGTVLKGGLKQNNNNIVVKKPAAVKLPPPLAAAATTATARPIGPVVAAAAASFQHGAAAAINNTKHATLAIGGTKQQQQRLPMTTPLTKRPPVAATPSGRQARHGEVLLYVYFFLKKFAFLWHFLWHWSSLTLSRLDFSTFSTHKHTQFQEWLTRRSRTGSRGSIR
jgi:hypothetical protein